MSSEHRVKARRCSMCGINYPPFVAVCRACGEDTWAINRGEPDANWQELVSMHEQRIAADAPASPYPHRHDNEAPIYRDARGLLWVTHTDLLGNGYRSVTEDMILYINGKFFEAQGFSEGAGAWLIEEVQVDGAADSLEPSMFGESEA